MLKKDALKLIDDHKNKLLNPVEMLEWTALRVTVLSVPDDVWDESVVKAANIMNQ